MGVILAQVGPKRAFAVANCVTDRPVENPSVARVLGEIADLLEQGRELFRVRAYRTGAQVVADSPVRVADLDVPALLEIDGIGKDLAARIRDIAATGTTSLRDELLTSSRPRSSR